MKVLIKYSPNVIRLRGDMEREAVANYMYNKHGVIFIDRTFACNFLMKYNADVVLYKYNSIEFYYPIFN